MRDLNHNLIELTDSYKASHWLQYPPRTESVASYFEARTGEAIVFFGLQYILKRYLEGEVVHAEDVEASRGLFQDHMGVFNLEGWQHIVSEHAGCLPLQIKALPEGSVVSAHTPLFTVRNTCPRDYWLTSYVETLLDQVWYPSTVASKSRAAKRVILDYLDKTGDPTLVDFKLHDFGARGVSSMESAAIGGAAHLVNFKGTDTVPALRLLRDYYQEDMAGFSIPAAEHSTITAWGRERELDAYANMLDQFPDGLVAVVSDSYDVLRATRDFWGKDLRGKVLSRDGTLVVRPDPGPPAATTLDVVEALGEAYGSERNARGYRVLDSHIRVIWGDGLVLDTIAEILAALEQSGWSADNITFGMGGGLLQRVHRDEFGFSYKAYEAVVDGRRRFIGKTPAGDTAKNSRLEGLDETGMRTVFLDGRLENEGVFEDVRRLAAIGM